MGAAAEEDLGPLGAIHFRRFYHSVFIAFARLDERALQNVLIHRTNNDICLMAADVCVSCFHFVEAVGCDDQQLADKLRRYPGYGLLGSIANTRKHFRRRKPKGQVELEAQLAYEYRAPDQFGFMETMVFAIDSAGARHNVLELIGGFVQFVAAETGIMRAFAYRRARPRQFGNVALARLTYETLSTQDIQMSFWHATENGSWEPIDPPRVHFAVEDDRSARHLVGRFDVSYDIERIHKRLEQT